MDTSGHYRMHYNDRFEQIDSLACAHCAFLVVAFVAPGDKSGLPVYARMRGLIVKHLHDTHHQELARGPLDAPYQTGHLVLGDILYDDLEC